MKLSDIVRHYRAEHGISQRQFAAMCSVSHGYISLIEGEKNYKTNKKMNVTLDKMKKLADGMDISLHELLTKVDDMVVSLEYDNDFALTEEISEGERVLLELFRSVPKEKQRMVVEMIRAALQTER